MVSKSGTNSASSTATPSRRRPASKKATKITTAIEFEESTNSIINGKILHSSTNKPIMFVNQNKENKKPNIILHLKCSLKDLETTHENIHTEYKYNPEVPPEVVAYDGKTSYSFIEPKEDSSSSSTIASHTGENLPTVSVPFNNEKNTHICKSSAAGGTSNSSNEMDQINHKLKKLKLALFKNTMEEKKAACFWCSYDFENETCYIPKYQCDETIQVYGSFCTPECAAAFLFREDIDDSLKFERFHLLNQIYGKVYGYEKNIQPAPNPFYLLSKYYGTLSIDEYRKLSRAHKNIMVLERPLTRVLPELHEEKDKGIIGSGTGTYRVKRQSDMSNRPSKNMILKEAFGIA